MTKLIVGQNDFGSWCISNNREDLLKEWHYEKNEISPSQISPKSHKRVWWRCSKGHEWESVLSNRTSLNTGCPFCAGNNTIEGVNDLQTLFPEIAAEWHQTKNGNLKPTDYSAGSTVKVWWKCDRGHEWQAIINNRTGKNSGCPICAKHKKYRSVQNIETKEIFGSIDEATKACGLKSSSAITQCCQGKQKTAGGYHWEYVDE